MIISSSIINEFIYPISSATISNHHNHQYQHHSFNPTSSQHRQLHIFIIIHHFSDSQSPTRNHHVPIPVHHHLRHLHNHLLRRSSSPSFADHLRYSKPSP
ncbi:hypothetical protein HanIR_Chr04g0203451 [Helianthus annuus]|nr:hypothetical protein HanIR_Chr04g0203451 [Helianthus annuus]